MKLRGFTIVELLVVIIVIAVLVALSIVGYSGISSKATANSLQSDLNNAKKALLNFQNSSSSGLFPTAINCTNPSATEICITPSVNTTFSYTVNNSSTPANFNLTATNGNVKYWINNTSNTTTTPDLITSGLVLNLDAGNPTSYSGGGTTWYDLSNSTTNASLVNGPVYEASSSGGIMFDGIDDYVSVTSPITSSLSGFTAEVVFKSTDSGNSGNAYLVFDHITGSWPLWFGKSQSNEWYYFWNLAGSKGRAARISSSSYKANSYVYVSVRGSLNSNPIDTGNYSELIVNGATYSTTHRNDVVASYGFPGSTVRLAKRESSSWNGELGATVANYSAITVANFRIYNRILTREEISQNFNAIRGRYGL